jgi:arylsulfatase A-like enzyme
MSHSRKNVLFVVVDDLRPELACYGHPLAISPNIDRLAERGILFKHAYCQQAICAASRASVLTGTRPDTTRIYDLRTPVRSVMPEVTTLPQHFKQNGYETISIGKIYHHSHDDREGWSKEPILNKGDWQGRGYLTDEAIEAIALNDRTKAEKSGAIGPPFESADVPDNAYHDGMDADSAIAELQRLQRSEQPFFLALGFHKPHLPFNAPKKYWDMYDHALVPLAENPFQPEGVTEYSLTNFGELRQYFGIPQEGPIPDDLARKLIHGYLACVSYMDAQLGRVLDELDRLGLAKDTVVMLWGDHGWKLGEHAAWSKHSNFETDTRAPLIVSVPDMKQAGRTTDALVEFIDMYPSLCDICGLEKPAHTEGRSFAPLLDDPALPWKEGAFSQYPRSKVMGYTVLTAKYRYTEWREWVGGKADGAKAGGLMANELYDHRVHSQENVNLAGKPEFVDEVRELSALLQTVMSVQD